MPAEDIRHPEKQPIVFKRRQEKNIKDKKREKRGRDGDTSWERRLKKESFQTAENTLTGESVASLGTSEGNITRRKNK